MPCLTHHLRKSRTSISTFLWPSPKLPHTLTPRFPPNSLIGLGRVAPTSSISSLKALVPPGLHGNLIWSLPFKSSQREPLFSPIPYSSRTRGKKYPPLLPYCNFKSIFFSAQSLSRSPESLEVHSLAPAPAPWCCCLQTLWSDPWFINVLPLSSLSSPHYVYFLPRIPSCQGLSLPITPADPEPRILLLLIFN